MGARTDEEAEYEQWANGWRDFVDRRIELRLAPLHDAIAKFVVEYVSDKLRAKIGALDRRIDDLATKAEQRSSDTAEIVVPKFSRDRDAA